MPILYDEVFVYPRGILTVQEFKPPRNGRIVKFNLPNGYFQKEVWTIIDGQFSGPFTKASPLETEIKGIELLRAGCHMATVIAIDTKESPLEPIPLVFNPIPLTLSSGELAMVELSGTIRATARVKNTKELLLDYFEKNYSSAESRIQSILLDCFNNEIIRRLPETIGLIHKMNGVNVLDELSEEIRRTCCRRAEEEYSDYHWFEITTCGLELTSPNMNQIIEKENYLWRIEQEKGIKLTEIELKTIEATEAAKIRMVEKTHDALLAVYEREPIPAEMMTLLVAYVQNNPMIQPKELIDVCDKFKSLSQTHSMDTLIKNVKALGYLPENKS